MTCTEFEDSLLDYIDNRGDSKLVPLIEAHVGDCKQCEALYHAHLAVDGAMMLVAQPNLPADFAIRISRSRKPAKPENMPTIPPRLIWDFVGCLGVAIAGAFIALRLAPHLTADLMLVIAALLFSSGAFLIVCNPDGLPD